VSERFNEQARQVIILAQHEARELKHNYIGIEHFLLALLRVETGRGKELLDSAGVTAGEIRAKILSSVGTGTETPSG
jgi:ATP-dependent Clp protease ATP-binding subunit ClpC